MTPRPIYLSSRRTIMDGEVVTLAFEFRDSHGVFGVSCDPIGPFIVSASRQGVMIEYSRHLSPDDIDDLRRALSIAKVIMARLSGRYGKPSLYPTTPTIAEEA